MRQLDSSRQAGTFPSPLPLTISPNWDVPHLDEAGLDREVPLVGFCRLHHQTALAAGGGRASAANSRAQSGCRVGTDAPHGASAQASRPPGAGLGRDHGCRDLKLTTLAGAAAPCQKDIQLIGRPGRYNKVAAGLCPQAFPQQASTFVPAHFCAFACCRSAVRPLFITLIVVSTEKIEADRLPRHRGQRFSYTRPLRPLRALVSTGRHQQ